MLTNLNFSTNYFEIKSNKSIFLPIRCSSESWITRSSFQKPISQIRLYFYALYYVTSISSEIGMGGFTPQTMGEILQTITLSFVGFIFFIYINAKIISISLHRDYELTAYQEAMKDLIKFMNYR